MNGLLICAGEAKMKNIGDYIQSVAQEAFFSQIDCLVERESINSFSAKEKVNLIMNAWWMWKPENFPPSESINPLFISFHVVPSIAKRLLSNESVKYLKKYEPIGARDTGTKELLEKNGIKSYFSGCLTLTLGKKFKSEKKEKIIFVDPYYETGGCRNQLAPLRFIKCFFLLVKHYKIVKLLKKKFTFEYHTLLSKVFKMKALDELIMCASFYDTYGKMFSDDLLLDAEYVTHNVKRSDFGSEEEKLEYARHLIKEYANSKLVVTSRIHCALPCLGVETPVIFVTSDALNGNAVRSSGRFGGLIDLFHIAKWTKKGVEPITQELKEKTENNKITQGFSIKNYDYYKPLKKKLEETIECWQANDFSLKNS